MSLSYINEKFSLAVRGMAISPASLSERLRDAWMQLHTLRSEDVTDPDLRHRYDSFHSSLTRHFEGTPSDENLLAREVCDLADAFHNLSNESR